VTGGTKPLKEGVENR